MTTTRVALASVSIALISLISHAGEAASLNTLTEAEMKAGWKLLFDGKTNKGWRRFKGEGMPPSWKVANGSLVSLPKSGETTGDIVTLNQYENFELTLEWKMAPGGNSGAVYRVTEEMKNPWETGFEYQILDNHEQTRHVDGLNPLSSASACYALYAPSKDMTKPVGQWNRTRIIANGQHVEHWLNGKRVVAFDIGSKEWEAHLKTSKFMNTRNFGRVSKGHICLQDYGHPIGFRNIKIRELPAKEKN